VVSQTNEVVFDFSLWGFCPQVRTSRPMWRSDQRDEIGTLATVYRRTP